MPGADSILVLGHRGHLGSALARAADGAAEVIEGGRQAFDLARAVDDPGAVGRAIAQSASPVVINCAGYTDVDRAESQPELAMAVNAAGPGALARACASSGKHFIHISTDYVFDGAKNTPYAESHEPNPLGVYAKSKLEGEKLVRQALPGALIVRSAWLFGPDRAGFVDKMIKMARAGESLRVVSDQVGCPTYTPDLAGALLDLARRRVSGLLHVVNSGQASRLELARRALSMAGLDPEVIRPVTAREFGDLAPRPHYSVLDTRRFARLCGGPLPTWLDGLRRHLKSMEESV